jgi:hypothetical protein
MIYRPPLSARSPVAGLQTGLGWPRSIPMLSLRRKARSPLSPPKQLPRLAPSTSLRSLLPTPSHAQTVRRYTAESPSHPPLSSAPPPGPSSGCLQTLFPPAHLPFALPPRPSGDILANSSRIPPRFERAIHVLDPHLATRLQRNIPLPPSPSLTPARCRTMDEELVSLS